MDSIDTYFNTLLEEAARKPTSRILSGDFPPAARDILREALTQFYQNTCVRCRDEADQIGRIATGSAPWSPENVVALCSRCQGTSRHWSPDEVQRITRIAHRAAEILAAPALDQKPGTATPPASRAPSPAIPASRPARPTNPHWQPFVATALVGVLVGWILGRFSR